MGWRTEPEESDSIPANGKRLPSSLKHSHKFWGPTFSYSIGTRGSFPKVNGRDMKLAIQFHLVPRL